MITSYYGLLRNDSVSGSNHGITKVFDRPDEVATVRTGSMWTWISCILSFPLHLVPFWYCRIPFQDVFYYTNGSRMDSSCFEPLFLYLCVWHLKPWCLLVSLFCYFYLCLGRGHWIIFCCQIVFWNIKYKPLKDFWY